MPTERAVLLVGLDPKVVDYADPAIPPGMNAEIIRAGLDAALKDFSDLGVRADLCLTDRGETAEATVAAQLSSADYDCVVIGAGVRVPPSNLELFERILNAVHRHAPRAAIAFNTRPEDTAEAARRWLDGR